ncbi:MAG: hypothetical protein GY772_20540 [bacterium]|nr:hypothetical protein [bacterium]
MKRIALRQHLLARVLLFVEVFGAASESSEESGDSAIWVSDSEDEAP